ncbi:MAG: NUDIX domain-containing protein [Alphaproteobacteria bacterium]|nr:MAG: NUDIX domain-containing protein [Alphaproteobacteria bacterium]
MRLELDHSSLTALRRQTGAYAVVSDADDRVLLVRAGNGRFYLPGGRVEPFETAEEAVRREIEEECGWSARITGRLGAAAQPIFGGAVMLDSSYWSAELVNLVHEEPEHLMLWTPRSEAASRVHRAGDANAILGKMVPRGGIEPPTP